MIAGPTKFVESNVMLPNLRCLTLFMLTLVLGCGPRNEADRTISKPVSDVKEGHFEFVAPEGFRWNDRKRIYFNLHTRATISISHSGIPFESIDGEFIEGLMRAGKLELTRKETRALAGRNTLLLHGVGGTPEYPLESCVVIYGTANGSAHLTALFPTGMEKELKSQVESALLNSRYEVPE